MRTKCINDPECSGFTWKGSSPPQSVSVGCRKNKLEQNEGINGWEYNTHQYIRCDCMSILVILHERIFEYLPVFVFHFRHNVQHWQFCWALDFDRKYVCVSWVFLCQKFLKKKHFFAIDGHPNYANKYLFTNSTGDSVKIVPICDQTNNNCARTSDSWELATITLIPNYRKVRGNFKMKTGNKERTGQTERPCNRMIWSDGKVTFGYVNTFLIIVQLRVQICCCCFKGCLPECNHKDGPCDFCGSKFCCKKGIIKNGCDVW